MGFLKLAGLACRCVRLAKERLRPKRAAAPPALTGKGNAISQSRAAVRKLVQKRCVVKDARRHRIGRFRGRRAQQQEGVVAPPEAPRHGKLRGPARASGGVEESDKSDGSDTSDGSNSLTVFAGQSFLSVMMASFKA